MACSQNILTDFRPLWSQGSTSTALFHPMTAAINASEVHKVRASFAFYSSSGNCSVRAALQYSDDAQSWDTESELGPAFSASEGWSYGTSFTDVTTGSPTRKIWIRFGLVAKNASGTSIEFCRAKLQLDFEGAG